MNEERYDKDSLDEVVQDDWTLKAEDLDPQRIKRMSARELGTFGELLASSYLIERGWDVLEHNYRCPEGEADVIAYDPSDDAVVLVEVKTRRVRSMSVMPEEAVDVRKRRRYRRIAACYVMDRFPIMKIRFDVVAIKFFNGELAELEHHFDVFMWEAE